MPAYVNALDRMYTHDIFVFLHSENDKDVCMIVFISVHEYLELPLISAIPKT